jgi:hypothetical protein
VFVNDVYFTAEDILELVVGTEAAVEAEAEAEVGGHGDSSPRGSPSVDMACALDFEKLKFYDRWVSRDISGGLMDDWYPYVREATDAAGQAAVRDRRPFRVYACWNGLAAFRVLPFLAGLVTPPAAVSHTESGAAVVSAQRQGLGPGRGIRFRTWFDREPISPNPAAVAATLAGSSERVFSASQCPASECQLFCKDLWSLGFGRIFVNPRVQVYYEVRAALYHHSFLIVAEIASDIWHALRAALHLTPPPPPPPPVPDPERPLAGPIRGRTIPLPARAPHTRRLGYGPADAPLDITCGQ